MNSKFQAPDAASSDTRFFTNQGDDKLENRLREALKASKSFDILVGYFFSSGFLSLAPHLTSDHKIRILVGLGMDKYIHSWENDARKMTYEEHCRSFRRDFIKDLQEDAADDDRTLKGARKFMNLVQNGNLEVKIHPERNIHAKLYIATFKEGMDEGRVFTGSSNLTHSGLNDRYEFNIELKDIGDYRFAKSRFEELWSEAVSIDSNDIIDAYKQTWVNPDFTPYDIYLKFLYEYFEDYFKQREELKLDDKSELPENYTRLSYQMQAVSQARRILEQHGGVFLSDVVGLGKTYITALLLKRLLGQTLVICSPALKEYWQETLRKFNIGSYCEVESWGIIQNLVERADDFHHIVIDEAHGFRNQMSNRYKFLHELCYLKKVILVTATPFNNSLDDLEAQIGLFQPMRDSSIPGLPHNNLLDFFHSRKKDISNAKNDFQKLNSVRRAANEAREQVLNHIMVRRTRSDIREYFKDDIDKEGLSFPEIAPPEMISYGYNNTTEVVFQETLKLISKLEYVRYSAPLYLEDPLSAFDSQRYVNMRGFMKCILVKRMDSSFTAFRKSLKRFIKSYERFIDMFDGGDVFISKKLDVYNYLDSDNIKGLFAESDLQENKQRLMELVEEGKVEYYPAADFTEDFPKKLASDLKIFRKMLQMWEAVGAEPDDDPKLKKLLDTLRDNSDLRESKILLFSEAKETIEYLYKTLHRQYPGEVMAYFSQGGYLDGEKTSGINRLQEVLRSNFDPNAKTQRDNIRILLATDILSEGVNLHRANIVINYDLPWNPTRVLQRVGRVNRVGTEHKKIHIFNIFPSLSGDKELGLSKNIKEKISAFHTALGEDAKYLTGDENPQSYKIFEENLASVMDVTSYEDDKFDENSELHYFKFIENIREKDPHLFDRVKNLPNRLRAYRPFDNDSSQHAEGLEAPYLLSFFRRDMVKKFIAVHCGADGDLQHRDLLFSEAAKILRASPTDKALKETSAIEEFLETAKERFHALLTDPIDVQISSRSNEGKIMANIKLVMDDKQLMERDDNRQFLADVKSLIQRGVVPPMVFSDIKAETGGYADGLEFLGILQKHLKFYLKHNKKQDSQDDGKEEVILSNFFVEDA